MWLFPCPLYGQALALSCPSLQCCYSVLIQILSLPWSGPWPFPCSSLSHHVLVLPSPYTGPSSALSALALNPFVLLSLALMMFFLARGRKVNSGNWRDVLLVDDVFTTRATADSCARLLLRSGAASVCVLTLARTHHAWRG